MRYLYLLVLSVVVFSACQNDVTLVRINQESYTLNSMKDRIQIVPADDSAKIMQKVNDFVDQMLAITDAREKGYEKDPVVTAAFETNRKDITARGYYQTQVVDKIKISDSELRKEYAKFVDQYHLAQIVVVDSTVAATVEQGLKKGVPFEKLIEHSLDTLTESGDIGSFSALSIPEEFLGPIKRTKIGGVAGPLKFGEYIYFLKVIEHTKTDSPTFDEVKENIKNGLLRDRAMKASEDFIGRIMKESKVEYNQEGLDAMLKPDSLMTEKDLELWVVKKYDTSYVRVRTIIDAVRYQYNRSGADPKYLIERVLVPDLIYDAALRARAEKYPQIEKNLENALVSLIYQKYYSDNVLEKVSIDSIAVQAYFKDHKAEYPDKKLADVYTAISSKLRDAQIAILRSALFGELRKKYNPEIDQKAVAKLLAANKTRTPAPPTD